MVDLQTEKSFEISESCRFNWALICYPSLYRAYKYLKKSLGDWPKIIDFLFFFFGLFF